MAEEMVTITVTRFATLLRHDAELDILTSRIFNGASLSYDGKGLYLADNLAEAIKAMYPNAYKSKYNELLKAKEVKGE